MIAEILSTGDEVLTGAVVDSNAAHIAEVLSEEGIAVSRQSCVGDDVAQLVSILK
jgi:nicotinamide-nucleotide amidase